MGTDYKGVFSDLRQAEHPPIAWIVEAPIEIDRGLGAFGVA
jgi:hypothetical protein